MIIKTSHIIIDIKQTHTVLFILYAILYFIIIKNMFKNIFNKNRRDIFCALFSVKHSLLIVKSYSTKSKKNLQLLVLIMWWYDRRQKPLFSSSTFNIFVYIIIWFHGHLIHVIIKHKVFSPSYTHALYTYTGKTASHVCA